MIKEEEYLKAKQIVQEYEKQLNISDVMCKLNYKCDYILTAEQGHRVIKCLKCENVKPI
jgi:hypothetical protein